MASTVNDTLDMKYADLGVLEGKLKELFGSSYEIEVSQPKHWYRKAHTDFIPKDQHESYLLTIPRKLTTVCTSTISVHKAYNITERETDDPE